MLIALASIFYTIGLISLLPLSYDATTSNVFNEAQPSNDNTTLIDCDEGFNGGDYSDLSNTFAWNRAGQVSITFKFFQQINISRISLFFWNSPSNSILVPNVMIYWADYTLRNFNRITNVATNSPNRNEDGQSVVNIDINDNRLKYLYLRIVMTFYVNSKWIFLGEVQFCGELLANG